MGNSGPSAPKTDGTQARFVRANYLCTVKQIHSEGDVRELVQQFYAHATQDELIGHFFVHLDLAAHLPKITSFWCMVLLGDPTYQGSPMAAHMILDRRIRMEPQHFDRWLMLWERTVDELFTGDKADEAKQRARTIASVMLHKVQQARGN